MLKIGTHGAIGFAFCPFTFISLWMPLALFVISLVFSALISILYLLQVLSRLSTRASSSYSSSARASMSSANRRLVMLLPPMLTFPSCSSRASDMIRSRKMLKRVGDRRHPCLTPTVVLNHSPVLPFIKLSTKDQSKTIVLLQLELEQNNNSVKAIKTFCEGQSFVICFTYLYFDPVSQWCAGVAIPCFCLVLTFDSSKVLSVICLLLVMVH